MNTSALTPNFVKAEKEKIIFQAALKAYATYGIAGTTTRRIAEIAGIGKSTIYEYFKNKDELMNASFEYLMTGMLEGHKNIHEIAKKDPVSALSRYLETTIQISINEPATLLLISQYSLGILLNTDQFETAKCEYRKKMYPVVQNLIEEIRFIISTGIENKVFRPIEGLTMDSLVYTVCALIREIQAQAFIQNRDELSKTCTAIRETVLRLLGII